MKLALGPLWARTAIHIVFLSGSLGLISSFVRLHSDARSLASLPDNPKRRIWRLKRLLLPNANVIEARREEAGRPEIIPLAKRSLRQRYRSNAV